MTKTEAITWLSQISAWIERETAMNYAGAREAAMNYAVAIDMAIEVLKAQKRKYTFGNDEFSLEAAYHDCKMVFDGITDDESYQEADTGLILHYANEIIYALRKALEVEQSEQKIWKERYEDLPSAQPNLQPTCNNVATDFISRQAAIDLIDGIEAERLKGTVELIYAPAIKGLRALPSAQPERKTGQWIYGEKDGQDGWYCSECKGFIPWDYDYYGLNNIDFIKDFKTCPFCDSKMISYTGMKEGAQE